MNRSGARTAALASLLLVSGCTGVSEGGASTTSDTVVRVTSEADVVGIDEVEDLGSPVLDELDVGANTLVWVHDQEPITMHYDDPAARLTVTSWIRQSLIEGLYGVSGATEFYPELLADEGEVLENDDGSVTIDLTLRNDLVWSNGDRLTTEHVAYTWDIWREGCEVEEDGRIVIGPACRYLAADREGLDLITELDVASDTEFSITFVQFFAGWKGLFDEIYHPSFGSSADEVNEALATWQTPAGEILASSGPMRFDEWERGRWLSLTRNDQYHGSVSPDARNRGPADVDGVLVRFVQDAETLVRAIESGEGHVMMTDPQPAFGQRLTGNVDFTVASTAGPVFEHLGLNLLNPHLADPLVRQALVLAVDKSEVVESLYRPLFGMVLPTDGLGNVYWMTDQRFYEDHQVPFRGAQPSVAAERLAEAGYVTDDNGGLSHPERGPLVLRIGTTGGDPLREQQQEILAAQIEEAGFEVVIDNVPGDAYFTSQPFASEALLASITAGADGDSTIWDLAQFAWAGSPWPGVNSANYRAGDVANPYGFANPDFDVMATECDAMVANVERAACYNSLDLFVTTLEAGDDGLFVIPITQTPAYYGYRSDQLSGAGIGSGADAAGPLANVVDFSFK